ncbi:hypothetical protein EDB84DRAFT_1443541 [Lactarius hengduanensis]|nr:hypothetical protein EDB84DRAFT_1443541 [Lactarius hengduanensis]
MTLAIPREAIRQDAPATAVSDQYPPSEPGGTPPPFAMPIFQNEDTPTPPATPSRDYTRTVPNTPQQTDITLDISMETEDIPDVVSVPATNPLSLRARLEAAAGRQPSPLNKSTPRNLIDKYTKSPSEGMPLVHFTSPTAALENVDLDLISLWEQAEGQKLLALPFDNEARFPKLHEDIKNRIFTAVAEITGSQSGFSTFTDTGIWELVKRVWSDADTLAFVDELTSNLPDDVTQDAYMTARAFLNSLHIFRLDVRDAGDTLTPRFNIYGLGRFIQNDDIWIGLRDYLASQTYASPMHGQGFVDPKPYHCGICHGIDHPCGLCPFPAIEGWNGPKRRHEESRSNRGRGARPRGMATGRQSNRPVRF